MNERCVNCRYSHSSTRDFRCRRYPPMVYSDGEGEFAMQQSAWPEVRGDNWCGEWHAKTKRVAERVG